LLTGRYAWRTRLSVGVAHAGDAPLIEANRPTLPDTLRQAGYRTAIVGKWHLGLRFDGGSRARILDGPLQHGFDTFFGLAGNFYEDDLLFFIEDDRAVDAQRISVGRVAGWDSRTIGPVLAERALAFLEDHVRYHGDRPFFLYYAASANHEPFTPPASLRGYPVAGVSGIGSRADMVVENDVVVGELLARLTALGIADDTLFIFTSDNGANVYNNPSHRANLNLRGRKNRIYEGGHRVPLLVRWPNGGVPAGQASAAEVSLVDFYATLAELVGQPLPEGASPDGSSRLGVWRGLDSSPRAAPLVMHQHRFDPRIDGVADRGALPFFAIRDGRWKLVVDDRDAPWALFDLEEDPAEGRDLRELHPERVRALKGELDRIRGV
jgi:arylsulfatase A-like enzyme